MGHIYLFMSHMHGTLCTKITRVASHRMSSQLATLTSSLYTFYLDGKGVQLTAASTRMQLRPISSSPMGAITLVMQAMLAKPCF